MSGPLYSAEVLATRPDLLQGREARCICGKLRPSTDGNLLAFFEYRGPESSTAQERCGSCAYNQVAHDKPRRHNSLVCASFTPAPEGMQYDSFYCGCRGWD